MVAGPSRSDVEGDLSLEVHRATADVYEDGRDPKLVVELVNHSKTQAYPIVTSNDGSEAGWREPHVWYTFERDAAGGGWTDITAAVGARCGNYAEDWSTDVRTLAPGERVVLPWFDFGNREVDGAARVRITAHYAYGDVAHKLDRAKVPPALWGMPSYALASTPLVLDVARPLALEVRLKKALPVDGDVTLAPVLDVILTNQSPLPRAFAMPEDGAQLAFELSGTARDGSPLVRMLSVPGFVTHGADELLAPSASRSLVGPTTKLERWSDDGEEQAAGTFTRVRAVYRQTFREGDVVRGRPVDHGREGNNDGGVTRHSGQRRNTRRVVSPWVTMP